MDSELWRLRNYINDIQKGFENDIRVICRDGETSLSKALVCARSPAFKRMLDSSFKESTTNIVEFPENNILPMKVIINYLQYANVDVETLVEEDVEILDFALRYEINELVEIITQELLESAKLPEYAPTVYSLCTDERYENIKNAAFLTISGCYMQPRIKFTCVNCKHLYNKTILKCQLCKNCNTKYHITLKNQKCKNGHIINTTGCSCTVESCKRADVVASPDLLNFTGVRDEIQLELTRKHLEHINK
ncbi:hypothetical protein PV-S19_0202 [Pacmanvirus S19]|nr:hypothetical protein PV-S19_0202 [Pacmanvirus S19]